MRDRFNQIFLDNIAREGSDRLLQWITERSDFFVAPASTKYHSAFPGGLVKHSVAVYDRLIANLSISSIKTNPSAESVAIVALLHDLCKTNFYKLDTRNVKDSEGNWKAVPFYTIDDQVPFGHGEKSVWMLQSFIKLSREESMSIRWHMGDTEAAKVYRQYPLALMLHISDMQAAFLDEGEEE